MNPTRTVAVALLAFGLPISIVTWHNREHLAGLADIEPSPPEGRVIYFTTSG